MSHNVTSQAWLSGKEGGQWPQTIFNNILATVDISRACYFHKKVKFFFQNFSLLAKLAT